MWLALIAVFVIALAALLALSMDRGAPHDREARTVRTRPPGRD